MIRIAIHTRSASLPSTGVRLIARVPQSTVASTQAVFEISLVHAVEPLQSTAAVHLSFSPIALVDLTVLEHVLAETIDHIA